jgi:hypothetical protein
MSKWTTLEDTVRAMGASSHPLFTQSLNENAIVNKPRSLDSYRRSDRIEDVAFAVMAKDNQRRIHEAQEYEDQKNSPETKFAHRGDAVRTIRNLWKDMRANVAPSERQGTCTDDGWSMVETPKFVAALKECARLYGVHEAFILQNCVAAQTIDEIVDGRKEPLTIAEAADCYHKLAENIGVSFQTARSAWKDLCEEGKAKFEGKPIVNEVTGQRIDEDIWNDPEFARQFVELHEVHEGYRWIDGDLYFISTQRGINEACDEVETAKFMQWERQQRMASIMDGRGFSR